MQADEDQEVKEMVAVVSMEVEEDETVVEEQADKEMVRTDHNQIIVFEHRQIKHTIAIISGHIRIIYVVRHSPNQMSEN